MICISPTNKYQILTDDEGYYTGIQWHVYRDYKVTRFSMNVDGIFLFI